MFDVDFELRFEGEDELSMDFYWVVRCLRGQQAGLVAMMRSLSISKILLMFSSEIAALACS